MSRREDFDNALWSDPDFLAMSATARYVYIWTWTNPRCGMAGIYRFTPAQAVYELGLTETEITAALEELADARFGFYEDNVLWVRSRVKRLRQKTVQIAKAIRNDLANIPRAHPLREQFVTTYGSLSWLRIALAGDPHEGPLDSPDPQDGQPTVHGTGGGTGGRGFNRHARATAPALYAPDPWAQQIQAEHFADFTVSAIEGAVFTLKCRRREPTIEAIRDLLTGKAAA